VVRRKVLIAVSGTGGHVYPGIALAEELRARHDDLGVLFVAAKGKPSSAWIRDAGFDVAEVPLRGFSRRPGSEADDGGGAEAGEGPRGEWWR